MVSGGCRIALYPVGRVRARTPNPVCMRAGAAQERWDPSETAAFAGHRMSTVTHPSRCAGGEAGAYSRVRRALEDGAAGNEASLKIAPERDRELAGQGDDGDLADAPFAITDALLEPARELAFRLMLEPEPGELDQGGPRPSVAGLADALLAPLRAAVEGRASEADEAADLTAIIEVAVIDLVGKHLGDGLADALEPQRCSCRRGAGAGGTQVGLDRGLD